MGSLTEKIRMATNRLDCTVLLLASRKKRKIMIISSTRNGRHKKKQISISYYENRKRKINLDFVQRFPTPERVGL